MIPLLEVKVTCSAILWRTLQALPALNIDRFRLRDFLRLTGCVPRTVDRTAFLRRSETPEGVVQIMKAHRFRDVLIHAAFETLFTGAGRRLSGHTDDGDITVHAFTSLNVGRELETVHTRHPQVHQHR